MNIGHIPVLLNEALKCLNLKPGQTIVDGTLGGGGHAQAILSSILPGGKLIAIDKDEIAIERCRLRLREFKSDIYFVHSDFKKIKSIVETLNIKQFDAAILDLGVSSYQLDETERGFSYNNDAMLDMRMDRNESITAKYIINRYTQKDLERLIKNYGEEKWAARIADFIVKERSDKQINTTGELVKIIKKAIPKGARKDGPHPAKRTFQALRIEVNKELDGLESALEDYVKLLSPKGRLAVITFHSLEDRIVKKTFKSLQNPCDCPKNLPVCVCGKVSMGKIITKKPILPNEEEIKENPRARSAKLRVFEKFN